MALPPGTTLGPYEIVALIGKGGMGEVYRARDARLGRDVAVKVLPAAFSSDADRLRRFEQEARAAAALNHPNILAVHDIGTHEGAPYIVSELLEGDTLRARLDDGQVPLRKLVDYAVQIANGLAAAHGKGIAHRDLKPENLFVITDGRVKILDFGLAKLTEGEPPQSSVSALPTVAPDTLPGMVLGTVGYMAPEQVRGRAVDHRADIFALGAILYELLSGRRAFRGDTVADTMTAILKEEPPGLPADERHIPPALARIVDRCLEKEAAARFQSTSDLAFALTALSTQSGSTEAIAAGHVEAPRRPDRLAWTVAAVLGVALTAALAVAAIQYVARVPAETRAIRFSIQPPDGASLPLISGLPLAVSPDGRHVAFVARATTGEEQIWVRSVDAMSSRALLGTEGAIAPFWSPDSRFLGFAAGGKLKRIEAAGGPATTLCDAPDYRGGTWSRDGVIVFSPAQNNSGLMRVSASGGVPTPATTMGKGEIGHARPMFFPDGRHFLYLTNGAGNDIYIASPDSTERTLLFKNPDSSNVAYSQGHLLFLRETTLLAQPFDTRRLVFTGAPFPVAEQIERTSNNPAIAVFAASESGVLAYQAAAPGSRYRLAWFDRSGKQVAELGDNADYGDVQLAPDGKRAAVTLIDAGRGTRDLWLIDVARSLRSRFTFDSANDWHPIWSPDGGRVVFSSFRKGRFDLYEKASSGAAADALLLRNDTNNYPTSWSQDGRFILYNTATGPTGSDVWALPLFGDRKPFPFLSSSFSEAGAQFSPDGRWVAYVSNESGPPEVYVVSFPGLGGKWQISSGGGGSPRWRGDGREIFYGSRDNRVMAVTVNGQGSTFEVGNQRQLFGPVRARLDQRSAYDVSADGQRFLINIIGDQNAALEPITVVVNWLDGIKK